MRAKPRVAPENSLSAAAENSQSSATPCGDGQWWLTANDMDGDWRRSGGHYRYPHYRQGLCCVCVRNGRRLWTVLPAQGRVCVCVCVVRARCVVVVVIVVVADWGSDRGREGEIRLFHSRFLRPSVRAFVRSVRPPARQPGWPAVDSHHHGTSVAFLFLLLLLLRLLLPGHAASPVVWMDGCHVSHGRTAVPVR